MAKSIYPPQADSNGNSGILPPPFGRNPASLPVFGLYLYQSIFRFFVDFYLFLWY
ncbi:MAG: hypothetical protein LBL56_01870 [Treponema sp.]|nr:hypothetical protein [Treponema sp.]